MATVHCFIELKEDEILKFVCFGQNVILLQGHFVQCLDKKIFK